MATPDTKARTLWTIGHSTRPWDVFLGMLGDAGISTLVDVRRFAGSRRNPQFSGEVMARELPIAGVAYLPMPDLGGRRKADPDTRNTAWRNASFRGYADYMETPPWQAARERLAERASRERVAIMCAEAVWWRCHRRIVADYLLVRGEAVFHLMGDDRIEPAKLTDGASVREDKSVIYPAS